MRRASPRSAWLAPGLCASVWGLVACAQAPPPAVSGAAPAARHARLEVEDAWCRPALQGANGAVYLTVVNPGEDADRLLGARSPDAAATELHQVQMIGDTMRMAPVEGGLEVPGGGRLELAPAGHHLMVIDLARDLLTGDRLALVLELEKSGELAVSVPVVMNPRTGE